MRAVHRQVRRGLQEEKSARRQHAPRFVQVRRRVGNMLDDGVREHEIERPRRERQLRGVRSCEGDVPHAFFLGQSDAGVAEPIREIDGDDLTGFLGERHTHPAATAPIVQHAPERADARAFEIAEHLRAAPVLEHGVVIFGSESNGRVLFDRAVVNHSQRSTHTRRPRGYRPISSTDAPGHASVRTS